jgi:hypothetical protein
MALTSCVRHVWYRQGATTADYNRDSYQCERDARQSGYFGTSYAAVVSIDEFYSRCMIAQGWERRQVDDDENVASGRKRRSRVATVPDRVDYEAIEEQRRAANELRRRNESIARGDAGAASDSPENKFGRCTESELREMLNAGLSSSAINTACF